MADEIRQTIVIEASLTKIQQDLKTLERNFAGSFGNIKNVAGAAFSALGVGLSVGAVVGFGKAVVDLAGNLQDLEDQTGISAQLLSGMNSLFEETGTSAEAFAKGIFTAQRNLGQINSATDPAAQAIKALGLNLDELRNAPTQRFLESIAAALAKIDNPVQRAALGSQLLGRQFRELAPALAQAAGRLEEFKAAGMTAEDIKRLDDFGDSITRLKNEVMVLASGPLAALANGIALLRNTLRGEGPQGFEALESSVKNLSETVARAMGLDIGRVANMTKEQLEEMGRSAPGAAKAVISSLIAARQELNAFIAKTPLGSGPANAPKNQSPFVPLPDLAAQKKAAEELKRIMEEAAKSTADAIDEAQKRAEAAGADMIDVFKALKKEGLTPAEAAVADINARFDELINKAVNAGAATGQSMQPFIDQLNFFRRQASLLATTPTTGADIVDAEQGQQIADQTQRVRDLGKTLADLRERQREAQQLSIALGNTFDLTSEQIAIQRQLVEALAREYGALSPEVQAAVDRLKELEGAQASGKAIEDVLSSIGGAMNNAVQGIAQGTQTASEAFRNLGLSIVTALTNAIVQILIIQPLIESLKASLKGVSLGSGGGGAGGGGFDLGGLFSGIFGGIGKLLGFDEGGIVPGRRGAPRLVMAHGGETILPTHRMSTAMAGVSAASAGGGVVYNIIDARGAQRGVSEEIRRAIAVSEQRAVQRSVSAVGEERSRSTNYRRRFGR